MNIQITGRHIQVTDALKQFAEEKVFALSKFAHKILKIHILLEVIKNIHHKCEINLEGGHLRLNAHAETDNMYESITKCVDKLSQQLKSHKYSHSDKHHRKATKTFEGDILESESIAVEESVTE